MKNLRKSTYAILPWGYDILLKHFGCIKKLSYKKRLQYLHFLRTKVVEPYGQEQKRDILLSHWTHRPAISSDIEKHIYHITVGWSHVIAEIALQGQRIMGHMDGLSRH